MCNNFQLIAFGFASIQGGPARGAYWHEKFIRGNRELCREIGKKDGTGIPPSVTGSPTEDSDTHHPPPIVTTPIIQNTLKKLGDFSLSGGNEGNGTADHQSLPQHPIDAATLVMRRLPVSSNPPERVSLLAEPNEGRHSLLQQGGGSDEGSNSILYRLSQTSITPLSLDYVSGDSLLGETSRMRGRRNQWGESSLPAAQVSQSLADQSNYTLPEDDVDPMVTSATLKGASSHSLFSMDLDDLLGEPDDFDDDYAGSRGYSRAHTTSSSRKQMTTTTIELANSCSSGPMQMSMASLMKQGCGSGLMSMSSSSSSLNNSWTERLSENEEATSSLTSDTSSLTTRKKKKKKSIPDKRV